MSTNKSYVICTTPRCGSWLLVEALAATGVAGRPEEYLRPDWFARYKSRASVEFQHRLHRDDPWPDGSVQGRADEESQFEVADYDRFLSEVLPLGTTPNGVFGLKVHRQQFVIAMRRLRACRGDTKVGDVELVRSWLAEPSFVYLWRRDELRRAISHYRAVISDVWWATETATDDGRLEAPSCEVLLEIDRLRVKAEEQNRQWRAMFDNVGVVPLVVTYEDLLADIQGTVSAVLSHIGVPNSAPVSRPRLVRQADAWTDVVAHSYITWNRGRINTSRGRSVTA